MRRLAERRPVYNSEADLQHSFARTVWELAPSIETRLEVQQAITGKSEHLDMLCIAEKRTAVEFKYWTRSWHGTAGPSEEEYHLRSHAATDLARRNFVFDVERLERFCNRRDQNGLALLITNEPSLWLAPTPGRPRTRDHEFRIHDGSILSGELLWAKGGYPANSRTLNGRYELSWNQYSRLEGDGGEFRFLAVEVAPRPSPETRKGQVR
jgi:hypothetical protein